MTDTHLPSALHDFENKLEQLIHHYQKVKAENNDLKIKHANLEQEKAQLQEQAAQARTRVEAMITRLKEMEYGS